MAAGLSATRRMHKPLLRPSAYSEILAGSERPLVVGGQAINIWAEVYANQAPALADYAPFTSADADIYGTRALAETLAKRQGWECHFITERDSVAVAVLVKAGMEGQPVLTIEVLKEVNGLSDSDLALSSMVELGDGYTYRAPSPIVLLKAKLYNLVSLANLDRPQDLKHARMLLQIIPHYFNELWSEVRASRLTEEILLAAVNYAGSVILAPFAVNAARSHGLDLRSIFPSSLRVGGPKKIGDVIQGICERVAAA